MQHNADLPRPASQPIADSMPVNRIRRWPNIETKLGDCPVSALTAIRVTLYRGACRNLACGTHIMMPKSGGGGG